MKNINEIIRSTKEWSLETISNYKTITIVLIVTDMLGVWYFLQWKRLAMALLIVLMAFLGYLLFLERKFPLPKDPKQQEQFKKQKKEVKKVEEEDNQPDEEVEEPEVSEEIQDNPLSFNIELPTAEEYEKRLNKALA